MQALKLFSVVFGLAAIVGFSDVPPVHAGQQIQLAQADVEQERKDWDKIVASNNADDFFDFLQKYPNGVFRSTAEFQIKRLLKQGSGAAANAPQTVTPPAAAPAPAKPAEPVIRKIEPVKPEPRKPALQAAPTQPTPVASPPQATPVTVPPPATSPALQKITDLRRNSQSELKRLGCYSGDVNGNWDERSAEALRLFARRKGLVMASTDPTPDALERMVIEKAGTCPAPACIVTEVLRNGQCMPKACHNGLFLHNDGKCRSRPEKTADEPAKPVQAATPAQAAPAEVETSPAAPVEATPAIAAPVVVQPAPAEAAPRRQNTEPAATKKPPVKKAEPAPAKRPKKAEKKPAPKPVVREKPQRRQAAPEVRKEQPVVRKRKGRAPCSAAVKGLPEYDYCE